MEGSDLQCNCNGSDLFSLIHKVGDKCAHGHTSTQYDQTQTARLKILALLFQKKTIEPYRIGHYVNIP